MKTITVKTAILLGILVALLVVLGTSYYYKEVHIPQPSAQGEVTVNVEGVPQSGGQVSVTVVNKTTGNDGG